MILVLSSQGRNLPESIHGFLVLETDFQLVFINIYAYVHVTDYTNYTFYISNHHCGFIAHASLWVIVWLKSLL